MLTLGPAAREIANLIRATCQSFGTPIAGDWSDLEVLQFAISLCDGTTAAQIRAVLDEAVPHSP